KYPEVPVIIITGVDEVETAVEFMKKGAWHYMVKPVEKSHLISHVKQLIELNEMKRKYSQLRHQFFS
ncbi:MAG: sigma-54-dependent Fis family transcriptional regulator, partial [Candidatus Aminicenantes bacterium]|nr:sigma-54-dependent Fis family transcriptional regulator [Candidatus Aminicenantes bacterium]NIQ72468.1 sigma-54-dependent Fis family transcriptional regulator [Candidatus Aminicenantes bacterium]NIT28496.1 sigma-54-dependent Fis family transcriptional regulator [Candidatus Aminicenantes bacterium]